MCLKTTEYSTTWLYQPITHQHNTLSEDDPLMKRCLEHHRLWVNPLCLSLKRHHYSPLGNWWQQFWGASELDGSSVPTFGATQVETIQSLFYSVQWQKTAPQLVASLPSQITAEFREYFCLFVCLLPNTWHLRFPQDHKHNFQMDRELPVPFTFCFCMLSRMSKLFNSEFYNFNYYANIESVFSWSFLFMLLGVTSLQIQFLVTFSVNQIEH